MMIVEQSKLYKFFYTKRDRRCDNGFRSFSKYFPTREAGFRYAEKSGIPESCISYIAPGTNRVITCGKVF